MPTDSCDEPTPLHPTATVTLSRNPTARVLCGLSAAACVASFFLDDAPLPKAIGSEAALAAGLGLAFLVAAGVLPFLWGAAGDATRGALCCLAGMGGLIAGVALMDAIGREVFAAADLALASALFLCEQSLKLRISSAGIERSRWFPWPGSRFIPWEAVESIRADLRTITTTTSHFLIDSETTTEHENLLIVEGQGQRLVINTTRYWGGAGIVGTVLERSGPPAFAWTLAGARSPAGANLGPVRLYSDRLAWSRVASFGEGGGLRGIYHLIFSLVTCGFWLAGYGLWLLVLRLRGFEEASLAEVRVRLDSGVLWLDRPDRLRGLASARVRNGIFLPEIVALLQAPPTDATPR